MAEAAHVPHILVWGNFRTVSVDKFAVSVFVCVLMSISTCMRGFVRVVFVVVVRVHRVEGVNDASGTEEQQCLEKRVRGEMEKPRHITAYANSKHHIAELANRGIRQHALNVKPNDGNCRRH